MAPAVGWACARTAFRSGSLRSGEVVFVLGQQQGDGFFNERYDGDPFLRGQDLEFDDGGGRQVGLQQALADAVGSPFGRSSGFGGVGGVEAQFRFGEHGVTSLIF